MATTTGPLLSIDARGQIGKAIVYSTWKGINTARKYTIPGNPNTTSQQETRGTFSWTHDAYKFLPANIQAPWVEYAKGQPFTPMNAFMQANIPQLRGESDIDEIVFVKPVRSGAPPAAVTATPGSGEVTILLTAPSLITGWTITKAIGIAMQNVDPGEEMERVISTSGEVDVSPYSITITGLLHAQPYVCGGFFQYMRPDSKVAYGAAITSVVTTT